MPSFTLTVRTSGRAPTPPAAPAREAPALAKVLVVVGVAVAAVATVVGVIVAFGGGDSSAGRYGDSLLGTTLGNEAVSAATVEAATSNQLPEVELAQASPPPPDLGGEWRISFSGVSSGTCSWSVVQTGANLAIRGPCDFVGSVRLTGSLDATTGRFSASGAADRICDGVTIDGIASAPTDSMHGTYECAWYTGWFTGSRVR